VPTKKSQFELASSSETKVEKEFPIVGIGASAGGLEPITKARVLRSCFGVCLLVKIWIA
jgi:chemotaxis response regulator CheB